MTSPSKWDKARKTGSGPAIHGASSPRHDDAAAAASSDKGTTYLAYIGHRHNGSSLLEMAINKRPWWQMTSDDSRTDWNFCWSQKAFDWDSFYGRAPGAPKQVLNRIRGNGGITIKDRLVVNMRKYAKAAKLDPSKPPYLPMSFIVTVAGEDDEPSKVDNGLKHDYELRALRDAAEAYNQKGEKMWIVRQQARTLNELGQPCRQSTHDDLSNLSPLQVKPPPANRGRGIHVFKTLKQAESFLKQKKPNSTWVVQKYMEDALLIDGRKFDIRLLVLLTADKRLFMYRDSYVRTAGVKYDPTIVTDQAMHLVNDAIQCKFKETYGMYEDCNKMSLDDFRTHLAENPLPSGRFLSVDNDLWPQMRESVAHVFCCGQGHFVPPPPNSSMFELFGLDFMVDEAGKAILIEANSGPALCRHGRVLEDMMPRLLEETFQKAVDTLLPPPAGATLPTPLDRFEEIVVLAPPVSGCADRLAAAEKADEKAAAHSPPRPRSAVNPEAVVKRLFAAAAPTIEELAARARARREREEKAVAAARLLFQAAQEARHNAIAASQTLKLNAEMGTLCRLDALSQTDVLSRLPLLKRPAYVERQRVWAHVGDEHVPVGVTFGSGLQVAGRTPANRRIPLGMSTIHVVN